MERSIQMGFFYQLFFLFLKINSYLQASFHQLIFVL